MNRRDTLKAAVGGLLGMLGVRAVPLEATRQYRYWREPREANGKAQMKMSLMRLESDLESGGAASATVLGDAGQAVTVYGSLAALPAGETVGCLWVGERWQLVSVQC